MSKQHSVSERSDIDDWKQVRLADVATKRAENVDPEETDVDRNVGLEHIEPNTPTPKWESITNVTSTKRRFYPGDILFAKLRPNLEKAAQPDFDGVCSTDIFTIEAGEDINRKYLLYRLSSKPAFDWARRTSAGTRMPRTSWGQFSNFEFKLPPLAEQRQIASVLYNIDLALQNIRESRDKLKRIKNGLANDLFTTGIGDNETEEIRLGPVSTEIPSDWNLRTIGEIYESQHIGTNERDDGSNGENIWLIKMGNLNFGTWDLSDVEEIGRDEELIEEYGLEEGDFLLNTRNTPELVGKTAVWDSDKTAVFDNNLMRIQFGEEVVSSKYINYFLSSEIGRRQLRSRVQGTTSVAAIYWNSLQEVEIPLPPSEVQHEIIEILSDIDKNRQQMADEIQQYKNIKKGLMQDLLSGSVRTTDSGIKPLKQVAKHD